MIEFLEDTWLLWVGLIMLVAGMSTAAVALDRASCNANWQDSGMPVRWSMLGGCQVHTPTGWIPADNYREIPK